jgi:predicted GNAT family acetyltransferase
MDVTDAEVRRDDAANRYELVVDGRVIGIATYSERDGSIVVPHTEVDRGLRGRGLGAVLVKGVLDDVGERGLRIVPLCPFVGRYIDEHEEYGHLVA